MTEKLSLAALSVLSLLGLWLAPWAALSRQTGALSTVLLLPARVIDFSGRTDPVPVAGMTAVLILCILLLLTIGSFALLRTRLRYPVWLIAGLLLIVTTAVGLNNVTSAVRTVRVSLIEEALTGALESPTERMNVPALEALLQRAPEQSVELSILEARNAGFTVRRLAYPGAGLGLAAFLCFLTGILAVFFGLRTFERLSPVIDRTLRLIAVPATSIMLALLVAGFFILLLQPTPVSGGVEIIGWQMLLIGRLETLWHAYLTLFANSLGTVGGFAESLKFSTPLIFTGLAVAFGFRAGLFNIGAPGQMVLGAIFAMLVGLYLPGPRLIVLPAAVLASALGGGLWGAIPGWLKARFGANEVINTILLNYIAASLLLFILSSNLTFAAAALRIITALGVLLALVMVALLIPPLRRLLSRRPRLSFAVFGVLALITVVVVGAPRAGDSPISFRMPFKVPGSEPKSYPLQETARLQQLPSILGIDAATGFGEQVVQLNIALIVSGLMLILFILLFMRLLRQHPLWQRLVAAGLSALGVFGLLALMGFSQTTVIIPPTNLNTAFLIAIGAAIFMQVFLWRTKWGYELRAVGLAPKAAEYGGANISRNTVLAMAMSGAFAGLTACHYVLGGALEEYSLRQALPTGDGFDGIAVALLGGNTPVGIVLSAFLFGVLRNGGTVLNVTFSGLTRDVVSMVLALVVLFIAARGFLPEWLTNPLRRQAKEAVSPTPTPVQPILPDKGGA